MSSHYEILNVLSNVGQVKLAVAREKGSDRELWLRRYTVAAEESESLHDILDRVVQAQHPNLEAILEAGKDDEGWFAAIEKPRGVTLTEMLKRGPLTVHEFDQLVQQTLAAMAVLHEKRIAHLALRPEIIWVDKEAGTMKVCIAGVGEGQVRRLSDAAADPESYRCMAPEFWQQEAVGRRTDVYALGCIFYEALAGRPAFSAKTVEEMIQLHLRPNVTPLNVLAPHMQIWATSWVMAMMDGNAATRLRNVKAARSRYELGVHGMMPGTASIPVQVAGYAPAPNYCYPPAGYAPGYVLTSQVHPGSGSLPVSPVAATQPSTMPPATAAVLVSTASHSPVPAAAVAGDSSPTPTRKVASPPVAKQNLTPIYIGASALAFLVLALVFFLNVGNKPAPDETSNADVAEAATPTVSSTDGNPTFAKIEDALSGTSVPLYPRGTPPNSNNLVAWFSSRDWVQTYQSPTDAKETAATPGDKVFIWRDATELAGKFNLAGDRKKPEFFPTLNVVRIEPGGREHPVITFHQSEVLGGKTAEGAGKMPFDPGLREKGVTIVQALRCRPVAGLLTRSVRLGTLANQKIVTIQVDDKGTFLANLGRQSLYLPPVQGDHGRFCIVSLVWNADEGWAQLTCRTADGRSFTGTRSTQVPEENEVAERLQIGDSAASLTTAGYKFNGDVLETLVYNRGLKDDERQRVESWVSEYYFGLK